ncbi:bifunctional nuclease family protein [candidate division KSB1 bacterium]|nr:bifunctional nuclease family protein [candidate division KSB1 bacterium]
MLIAVRVDRVTLDTSTNRFVVILRDDKNHQWLPIIVGSNEAQAIALQLERINPPRPLTHDLMKTLLDAIDVSVSKIVVSDLKENTYYALISLKSNGHSQEVDARPSDAIALALRMKAPIFVSDEVMKRAAVKEKFEPEIERLEDDRDKLESLNIELQKAIKDERFEDAARIRDEINSLKEERNNEN